jgi:hypothetical protein
MNCDITHFISPYEVNHYYVFKFYGFGEYLQEEITW